jgi:hypothetical protein
MGRSSPPSQSLYPVAVQPNTSATSATVRKTFTRLGNRGEAWRPGPGQLSGWPSLFLVRLDVSGCARATRGDAEA